MIDLERVAAACGGTLTDPRVLELGAVTIDGRFGRTEAPWLTTGAGGLRLTPARIDALAAALAEIRRQQARDGGGRCVVPLVAGGQLVVHAADRADRGVTYLEIVGAVAPDADGVATLTDPERRKLAAILARDAQEDAG